MSALTVLYMVLPLPVLYTIHVIEELALKNKWILSHKDMLMERFPEYGSKIGALQKIGTKGHLLVAFEQFILILLATAYVLVQGPFCIQTFTAVFLAFSVHLIAHISKAVVLKSYIPGLVSSIILLVYVALGLRSIWHAMGILEILLYGAVGTALMVGNNLFINWIAAKLFVK